MSERPNTGSLSRAEVLRINSTPARIKDAFDIAKHAARDEALWLAATCQFLLSDNDKLRVENERLRAKLDRLGPQAGDTSEKGTT